MITNTAEIESLMFRYGSPVTGRVVNGENVGGWWFRKARVHGRCITSMKRRGILRGGKCSANDPAMQAWWIIGGLPKSKYRHRRLTVPRKGTPRTLRFGETEAVIG